jgi:hypothetical protein
METQRLKLVQVPNQVLYLLESFACDNLGVAAGAYRLRALQELPSQLRRHVGDGPGQQHVWFAWRIDDRTYLITGAMSLERSRERGRPVLEIRSYDVDGSLIEFAIWVRTGFDRWERCQC